MDPEKSQRFRIDTDMTRLEIVCVNCHRKNVFLCPTRGLHEWQDGKYIQDALPMLSAGQRELMISQVCPECFEAICQEEEY